MAVVYFGAPGVVTTSTSTRAHPRGSFNLSSFGSCTVQQVIQETITAVTASITYYKRGYQVSSGQYEFWRTNVRDDGPPSGNPLIDITVVGEVKEC